ncbi:LTA synthase family protein [Nitrosophilus alvini]|uniref:LTA synthase family protein n=1 Tax=Nitrosophilus alvini TaxID=2714855 RepID=UPI00190BAEB2|nr:alkaline phosphatase family protein [Nitrosophilus alvini]
MYNRTFPYIVGLLKNLILLQAIFLVIMSLFRLYLFFKFAPISSFDASAVEYFNAFLLGLRLDLSILGYVFAIPLLLIIFAYIFRKFISFEVLKKVLFVYFLVFYLFISLILAADIGFFSYFNDHINIMIFGIIDDDTAALWEIAKKNYNLWLIFSGAALYTYFIYRLVAFFVFKVSPLNLKNFGFIKQTILFFSFILITFLAIRGTLGMFPIYHWTKDIAADNFLNKVSKNSIYLFVQSVKQYKKSKTNDRDYIKEAGFESNIEDAFKIHCRKSDINSSDLLQNLVYKTPYNEKLQKNPLNVVVIMVESFGMPILKYQNTRFDIMRSLKKHFDEDILFTNFISTANGTIVSMEPMLLNLMARPKSVPYGQSMYQNVSFRQAAAKVYQKKGYETTFLYGGDLSWRNVGAFFAKQGFDNVEGKAKVLKELHLDAKKETHDWGVYDEHLYSYILKKLQNSKKPQFIFAMTTNNHPPYTVPSDYKSKKLYFSEELKKHLRGDLELIEKRLYDYQYALDMAGKFLDAIKSSPLAKNSVVVITADNNTIEGAMSYDDYLAESKLIPFYIYMPENFKPEHIDTSVPGSHKDIMPTLYNLTLSNTEYMAVGTNLLDKEFLHCGFNDKGIVVSEAGAFKLGKAVNEVQKECEKQYRATLAVTDYLVKSHLKQ